MTTRTITTRDLVNQESIQFIRPQTLHFSLIEARPNTKMYVFFDGINITSQCNGGVDIITDDVGQVSSFTYKIPAATYNVGTHDIVVTDTNSLSQLNVNGSTYGSAKAKFSADGRTDIFQTTKTTIVTVERPVPVPWDPLAQSFFTYGVKGGMFITAIEVYFADKDTTLPVRMEVRPMINGYPAQLEVNKPNFVSVLSATDISVSSDASVATKFVFNPPVYVREDADYCFVLRSNSNKYQVYTSRMGENSIEDGRKIYEQPYVGSVFKSENNITWTAEQFEDLKFTIYKAKFSTTPGVVTFSTGIPYLGVTGNNFLTTSTKKAVKYWHPQEHGLTVGSKFYIKTNGISFDTDSVYNGIPASEFEGEHLVTKVIDKQNLIFETTTAANKTGYIHGNVEYIKVTNGGSGYSNSDTVVISSPTSGTTATATLVTTNGVITGVTITNPGSNYESAPTVTISNGGTGATFEASIIPSFSVMVNKPMTGAIPKIDIHNFGTSSTINTMSTLKGSYDYGITADYYNLGKTVQFKENTSISNLNQNSVVASTYNKPSNNSNVVSVTLNTDNPNVSPVINLSTPPTLHVYSTRVNDQRNAYENVSELVNVDAIKSISVVSGGSGYTANPTVTIAPPALASGTTATATAAITGGVVTSITITNVGSGYNAIPAVTITPSNGVVTTTAVAVAVPYNSELLSSGGTAKARYVTQKTKLQMISNGVRLYSTISSVEGGSVDWYIRTSLSTSGVQHDDQTWTKLWCNTTRDKSSYIGEFLEYEFRLDTIPEYDTYDLKCILTAQDPVKSPVVNSYRVIVLA